MLSPIVCSCRSSSLETASYLRIPWVKSESLDDPSGLFSAPGTLIILGAELIALPGALVEPSFDLAKLLDIRYKSVLYQSVHRHPACFGR